MNSINPVIQSLIQAESEIKQLREELKCIVTENAFRKLLINDIEKAVSAEPMDIKEVLGFAPEGVRLSVRVSNVVNSRDRLLKAMEQIRQIANAAPSESTVEAVERAVRSPAVTGAPQAEETPKTEDAVNHPSHYKFADGVEVISLTEQLNFNRGNAVKYLARAGRKDAARDVQDLEKAAWYVQREIDRIKRREADK